MSIPHLLAEERGVVKMYGHEKNSKQFNYTIVKKMSLKIN